MLQKPLKVKGWCPCFVRESCETPSNWVTCQKYEIVEQELEPRSVWSQNPCAFPFSVQPVLVLRRSWLVELEWLSSERYNNSEYNWGFYVGICTLNRLKNHKIEFTYSYVFINIHFDLELLFCRLCHFWLHEWKDLENVAYYFSISNVHLEKVLAFSSQNVYNFTND